MFRRYTISRLFSGLSQVHHVKKFYKKVTVEPFNEDGAKGYTVKLDGRGAKSPDGHKFFVPTEPLAHLIAMEFLS